MTKAKKRTITKIRIIPGKTKSASKSKVEFERVKTSFWECVKCGVKHEVIYITPVEMCARCGGLAWRIVEGFKVVETTRNVFQDYLDEFEDDDEDEEDDWEEEDE